MDLVTFNRLTHGAYQNAEELHWLYEHHLKPLRPKTVIEVGVARGGTTRLLLDLVGEDGIVIGLDRKKSSIANDVRDHSRFHLIQGASNDPRTLKKVKALTERVDFLFIDGDHSPYGVMRDSETYLPLLRPGGLAVWHDVRRESPEGIKQSWYGVLKPRLLGASEYFADPYQAGFGLWYKTEDDAATLLDQAEAFLEEGKDMQAEGLLRRLVAHRRAHGHAWFDLAMALWDHHLEEAREALAMAVAARPNLYHHAYEWAQEVGEPAPQVLGESGNNKEQLDQAMKLRQMGLPKRALDALERIPDSEPEGPEALARRIPLLEECHAPMLEVSRALLNAVDIFPEHVQGSRLELLEREGKHLIEVLLSMQKYAEAVRLSDALSQRCPKFSEQAAEVLSSSLHFCIWAGKHGLATRGHLRPTNYYQSLMTRLSKKGAQRLVLLPSGSATGQFLENRPEALFSRVKIADNFKHGKSLSGHTIDDAKTLLPAHYDLAVISSPTHAGELFHQLTEQGFAVEQIYDMTKGSQAYA